MKKQTKKEAKKFTSKKTNNKNNGSDDFSDLGIEPPKIYRESQKKITEAQNRRQKKSDKEQNLTNAQRREKETKKRKKKNSLRKALIWCCSILGIIALGVVLSLTVFFRIDTISVSGSKIYTSQQILSQCTIEKGDNLFLADTDSAAERIEKNLPYVYKAKIKRKLPYTIEIKITDAEAAYSVVCEDNTYTLLDDNFKTLENGAQMKQAMLISNAEIKSAVPGTTISFKDENIASCLKTLGKVIKDNDFSEITAMYSEGLSSNYVIYDDRITIKLGNTKNAESKIYKALAACEKLDSSNSQSTGTMTVSDGKQIYFTAN